jgi:hypothetical protein
MNSTTTTKSAKMSDVLFQKLGNSWYIFAEVNNEFVYSVLPDGMDPRSTKLELYEVIEDHMKKVAKSRSDESQAA